MCEGPVGRVGVSARAHPRHGTRTRMPARLVRGYAFGTCFALYSLVTWCLWRAQALVSPVVRRMIQWERSKMSVQAATAAPAQECLTLRLEEVDSAVVTAFVDFVYQGCVTIAHDIELLLALGMLADRLDVGSLRRAVLERAQQLLAVDTCAMILQCSRCSGLPELEHKCIEFALKNFVDVSAHPSFLCLEQCVLQDLVADDRCVHTHVHVWVKPLVAGYVPSPVAVCALFARARVAKALPPCLDASLYPCTFPSSLSLALMLSGDVRLRLMAGWMWQVRRWCSRLWCAGVSVRSIACSSSSSRSSSAHARLTSWAQKASAASAHAAQRRRSKKTRKRRMGMGAEWRGAGAVTTKCRDSTAPPRPPMAHPAQGRRVRSRGGAACWIACGSPT